MSKILIGSQAIKHWFPDFPRNPKDTDYAIKDKTYSENNVEYLHNPILFKYTNEGVLPVDMLYTLKVSHLFWDINWDKHMWDVQWLLKKECKLNKELFNDLYEFFNTINGLNKRSELNMTSEDFFNNAIKCPYNHDLLHTFINPVPTYLKILKNDEEVDVDEVKFNNLSFEDKCNLVREEVYIMAYERYKLHYSIGYLRMLKKFIMNHAPLWEAIFIIENYLNLHKPEYNYIEKIENKIKEYEL